MTAFFFKHFSIEHDHSTMKVGTDGVLLGAWASLPEKSDARNLSLSSRDALPGTAKRFLDVGCGCGLISLMMAQRLGMMGWKPWEARVDAMDLDVASCEEASSNAGNSCYREYVSVFHSDYRQLPAYFRPGSYCRIVSNPPYFQDSLKCPGKQRNQARHTDTLPFEDLVSVSERLLEPAGRLCLILPPSSMECVLRLMPAYAPSLELRRLAQVFSKPGKACGRVMAEWGRREDGKVRASHPLLPVCHDILLHDEAGTYTEEYRNLVKDFYLWA